MRILIINVLDKRYGSTYRARAFYNGLKKLGFGCQYIESNYEGGDNDIISVAQADNLCSYFWAALRRAFICLTSPYDVCIIQKVLPVTLPSIWAAGFLRRKRVIVDWDDLDSEFQPSKTRRWLVLLSQRLFYFCPTEVITHSEYIERYVKKVGVKKVKIIPQIADIDIPNTEELGNGKLKDEIGLKDYTVFGYVVTLTEGGMRDFDKILGIYKQIEEIVPSAALLVIGGGPLYKKARIMLKDYKIKKYTITGLVNHKRIGEYISACDACLIYMRDDLGNQARVSLKLLEYCACKRAAIGRVVGETDRLLGEFVGDINDVKMKKDKDRFLEGVQDKAASAYKEVTEKFSPEILQEKLVSLLRG